MGLAETTPWEPQPAQRQEEDFLFSLRHKGSQGQVGISMASQLVLGPSYAAEGTNIHQPGKAGGRGEPRTKQALLLRSGRGKALLALWDTLSLSFFI